MTFVGHTLTGIVIGTIALPNETSWRWKSGFFASMMALANMPDAPFPYWGHSRYDISHSIFSNLTCLFILVPLALLPVLRPVVKCRAVVFAGAIAWLSHILLDTFYNRPGGLAIYWPFTDGRLALPLPWFEVLPGLPPPLTREQLKIFGIEMLAYGLLVILSILIRRALQQRGAPQPQKQMVDH